MGADINTSATHMSDLNVKDKFKYKAGQSKTKFSMWKGPQ